MNDADVPYSLDSDFDELQDKDKTVELVGFICTVETPVVIGEKNYTLFKFGLSNGQNRKIMCLVWNKDLIDKYQSEITINKIIHLDGAHCKASKFPMMLQQQGFLPFEIIIQNNTVVTFLGMQQPVIDMPPPVPPKEVDFENIIESEGKIAIDGYIKTEFSAIPSRYQNSTYGCGSITDEVYKITVNISNFQPIVLRKGTAVKVIGEVNSNSTLPLCITCKDTSMITQREDVPKLTNLQLMRGTRTYKRRVVPS